MRKTILVIVVGMLLTGCYKDPQSMTTVGNGFQVEFLFEKDGIKMYRFLDGGRHHYFTSTGETISSHSEGKNTVDENIQH
jgi:hypothetical protein